MKTIIADVESTGADTKTDQIIEAAWLVLPSTVDEFMAVKNPKTLNSYNQRFKPTIAISYGAMATHNIISTDLEDCIPSSEAELPSGVDYIIGHNIDFDVAMFGGGDPATRRICTLALSRWLYPELDSHKQAAMLYFIGHQIEQPGWARDMVKGAHAALDDMIMCAVLLRFLIQTLRSRGFLIDTWQMLSELSDEARIPTRMGFGKHKGDLIADVPASYVRWYRGTEDQDQYLLEAFKRAGK